MSAFAEAFEGAAATSLSFDHNHERSSIPV